jgi:hypothetical protein
MRSEGVYSNVGDCAGRLSTPLVCFSAITAMLMPAGSLSLRPPSATAPPSTRLALGPATATSPPMRLEQLTPSDAFPRTGSPAAGATPVRPTTETAADNAAGLVQLAVIGVEATSSPIRSMALSPDASLLATGHSDGLVRLWRINDGEKLWASPGHSEEVTDVAFVQGEDALVSASPWLANMWRTADGSLMATLEFPVTGCQGAAVLGEISGDGRTLAVAIGFTIEIWDVAEAVLLRSVSAGWNHVYAMAFSPHGESLAVYSVDSNYQSAGVDVFRVEDGTDLGYTDGPYTDLAIAADGQTLYLAGVEGIRGWRVAQDEMGPPMDAGTRADTWGMAFSPASDLLAAGSTDGGVFIWNLRMALLQLY